MSSEADGSDEEERLDGYSDGERIRLKRTGGLRLYFLLLLKAVKKQGTAMHHLSMERSEVFFFNLLLLFVVVSLTATYLPNQKHLCFFFHSPLSSC
jgi:hypothetical protein